MTDPRMRPEGHWLWTSGNAGFNLQPEMASEPSYQGVEAVRQRNNVLDRGGLLSTELPTYAGNNIGRPDVGQGDEFRARSYGGIPPARMAPPAPLMVAPIIPNQNEPRIRTFPGVAAPMPAAVGLEQVQSEAAKSTTPNPHDRQLVMLQMEEAIQQLPTERKKDYLEALRQAPDVCENESNHLMFLRRCDFDVWAAAKRLCLYWKTRKDLFGDRAYLPLLLTGDGAPTPDDLRSFEAGQCAFLPDTIHGRKVVFCDRRQKVAVATVDSKIRCLFLIAQIVANNEQAQIEGIIVLYLLSAPRWSEFPFSVVKKAFPIVEHVLPFRLQWHMLNFPTAPVVTNSKRRYKVQNLIVGALESLLEAGVKESNVQVHFEREPGDLYNLLWEMGLKRDGIPDVFGGEWSLVQHVKWCQQRKEQEWNEHRCFIHRVRVEKRNRLLTQTSNNDKGINVEFTLEVEERKRRVREKNLINARRKRDRRKQEWKDMQDERDQLMGEQEFLLAENARLLSLWDKAKQTVGSLKDDSDHTKYYT